MFLNRISVYYCFRFTPSSFVVLACHSLLVHKFTIPLPSVRHPLWVKVIGINFLWGCTSNSSAVWAHVSRQTTSSRSDNSGVLSPFLFHGFNLFIQTLNFFFFSTTLSIEIKRLADNSSSGPLFVTACVAAATSMLSR